MKKIFLTIALALFSFSTLNAGGFSVGVKGSYIEIEASGTEADKDGTADTSTRTKSVENDAFIAAIYAEYSMDDASWGAEGNGITIGLEHIPGSADVSDKFSRTDTELSITGDVDTASNTVIRTASAEVDNFNNLYLELPLYNSIFLRTGYTEMDVTTLETGDGGNSSTYGNTTVDGLNLGIGFKGISGNMTWKLAYEQTDFDTLSLNSSQSDKGNKITADLDTREINFSVGYRF